MTVTVSEPKLTEQVKENLDIYLSSLIDQVSTSVNLQFCIRTIAGLYRVGDFSAESDMLVNGLIGQRASLVASLHGHFKAQVRAIRNSSHFPGSTNIRPMRRMMTRRVPFDKDVTEATACVDFAYAEAQDPPRHQLKFLCFYLQLKFRDAEMDGLPDRLCFQIKENGLVYAIRVRSNEGALRQFRGEINEQILESDEAIEFPPPLDCDL
jgi:hypothetical protein